MNATNALALTALNATSFAYAADPESGANLPGVGNEWDGVVRFGLVNGIIVILGLVAAAYAIGYVANRRRGRGAH